MIFQIGKRRLENLRMVLMACINLLCKSFQNGCLQIQIRNCVFIDSELRSTKIISPVAWKFKIGDTTHARQLAVLDLDPLWSTGELFGPLRPSELQNTRSLEFRPKETWVLQKGFSVNHGNHSGSQALQRSEIQLSRFYDESRSWFSKGPPNCISSVHQRS